MTADIDPVLYYVDRSNQRGGRMLSVVDLVRAGTLTRGQAAWLLAAIEGGASWLVGAAPGGAGKTTVMSALLAMLPAGTKIRLTERGSGWEQSRQGDCVVCYEISSGWYDGYIWGEDVRHLAHLGAQGCQVVANLHADTLAEARDQVVGQNGACADDFNAFSVFLPIAISKGRGGPRRVVGPISCWNGKAWESREQEPQPSLREAAIAQFLDDCLQACTITIEAVRVAWLQWRECHAP